MQTFLAYDNFAASAVVLDNKRLGKQRVETLQILNTLTGRSNGWKSHPAVRMWEGYEHALCSYGLVICDEWIDRGFSDTVRDKILDIFRSLENVVDAPMPSWLGDMTLHASHRSNLLRKDPVYYGLFGWTEPHDLPYVWPV